ncbi:TonB family protein [Brevundimonas bacteroides]|uniref:TonB family protein n=1 Tax=Brevundimonas bacteroides TaxID=74311 RepID=UPI000494F161|nr:TonB family protein [Brevundimonas bacteroides]
MIPLILSVALVANPSIVPSALRVAPAAATASAPAPAPLLQGVTVTLECTAKASGKVEACRVMDETHPGLGFGEAAVALMNGAEVEPGPRDVQFARTIVFTP